MTRRVAVKSPSSMRSVSHGFACASVLRASRSSKNIAGARRLQVHRRARPPLERSPRAAARRRAAAASIAAISRSCAASGARVAARRPSRRQPQLHPPRVGGGRRARAPGLRSTSRATTAETELWWVCVRAASSLSDEPGASASVCSTKSWAPLRPTAFSAARDDSRSACTMRRMASSTIRDRPARMYWIPYNPFVHDGGRGRQARRGRRRRELSKSAGGRSPGGRGDPRVVRPSRSTGRAAAASCAGGARRRLVA